MKKRSYRAQKVNKLRWEEGADRDNAVMWAVDVAKVEQYEVLMDSEREVVGHGEVGAPGRDTDAA